MGLGMTLVEKIKKILGFTSPLQRRLSAEYMATALVLRGFAKDAAQKNPEFGARIEQAATFFDMASGAWATIEIEGLHNKDAPSKIDSAELFLVNVTPGRPEP